MAEISSLIKLLKGIEKIFEKFPVFYEVAINHTAELIELQKLIAKLKECIPLRNPASPVVEMEWRTT